MKKVFFPAIISTLILFIWQFISWAAVNFHEKAQSYTDKQDELLNAIKATGLKEGAYFLPLPKPGSSTAEQEAHNNAMIGKPWVMIQYHDAFKANMAMNFTRGLSIHFISSLILIWMIGLMANQTFMNILKVSLAIGFVGFLFYPYTNDIWYETFDTVASLMDAVVAWGLVGIFLGWYLKKPNP
jgi:hypothetical protein